MERSQHPDKSESSPATAARRRGAVSGALLVVGIALLGWFASSVWRQHQGSLAGQPISRAPALGPQTETIDLNPSQWITPGASPAPAASHAPDDGVEEPTA